jgi:CheY-like chemotaxis protein
MSDLLMRSDLDDEQRDYAETIRTSGRALLTIINDILDFSKLEAGRMELESIPFDLHECVDGALTLIQVISGEKGLELTSEIRPGTPRTIVGDGARLRQILLNLLNNAVKFTDSGRVTVTVEAEPPDADGAVEVHIAVRDTGLGIPADRVELLFQPFSQADVSVARRYGGTGLGLAISQRLAEAMGGRIWAESSGVPGEGSTFHVVIHTREAAPLPVPAADGDGALELDPRHAERHPLEILLVEDNAVNQKLALRMLARMGYDADLAANGLEAVQAVERERYDLVLMDVQMPEMDGLEATREIVARVPQSRRPWIVAMTANAMDSDRQRCMDAGMNAYIPKPIQIEELVAAVLATPVAAEEA